MGFPQRHWRLGSGLVLLSYISMHLLNHALGLVSLTLAEAGLRWSIRLWQSVPGTVLLYGAFAIHFSLALTTLYQRRHWRLPFTEWLRLWSGFSLPLLLIGHAVSTRLSVTLFDAEPSYEKVIAGLITGGSQGWQVALLAPGWVHGCLGLWIGLRHHAAIRRAKPALLALLVVVPLLSAGGFARMSQTVEAQQAVLARHAATARPRAAVLQVWRQSLLAAYLLMVGTAIAGGRWREYKERGEGS